MNARVSAESVSSLEQLETRLCFSAFPPVIAPTNVVAAALSSTVIRLDWVDASPNETGFMVFRSTVNSAWNLIDWKKVITTPMGSVSYFDTDLVPDTTYFYRLKARAITANSALSNSASATTLLTTADVFAKLNTDTGDLDVLGTPDKDIISLNLVGTNLKVTLNGTAQSFVNTDVKRISVLALSGDDRVSIGIGIIGLYISGGDGNDTLFGTSGDDRIDCGDDKNLIKGGDGNDSLTGGVGNDTIYGGLGDDTLTEGGGNNKLVGGDGNDLINGSLGRDSIYGQAGLDTLIGGGGSDFISQD